MKKYQKIASDQGMPLMYLTQSLHAKVQKQIESKYQNTHVMMAMRYGDKNIESVLKEIKNIPHHRLIVIPLFPQYSATTTASVFDEVSRCLKHWNFLPNLTFIRDYCNENGYIDALAQTLTTHWKNNPKSEKLLLSYHGLPEVNHVNGDPYACYCHKTTRLVSEKLDLPVSDVQTVFQSRFGPSRWLQPYTEETIIALAKSGVKTIDMIAPSFSVDCLETIDEIGREYQEIFQEHGGEAIHYIPALNDQPNAVHLIAQLISSQL